MRAAQRGRIRERDYWIDDAEPGLAQLDSYCAEYLVAGRGGEEPLIVIPGLAGSYELLFPLVQSLARHHRVFCYRIRGDSCPRMFERNYRFQDLVKDLEQLIASLRLERPAILGLSFGAAIATEFAINHPGRVSRLILSGGSVHFERRMPERIFQETLNRFPLPPNSSFINQFFKLLVSRKLPADSALLDFVIEQCWKTDQGVMAHRLRLLEEFDARDRLWSLTAPTLVLAGQHDIISPPLRQKQISDGVPDGRLSIIEGAGHLCFLTNPVQFARQIRRFTTRAAVASL